MSAIIILPSKGTDINKFINSLSISTKQYDKIIEGLKNLKVHIQLPKFELEFNANLKQNLIDLGIYKAFNIKDADFTGLVQNQKIYIKNIYQKTYLKIFEDGCEAASVTHHEGAAGSSGRPEKEKIYNMIVNKPFLFLLKNSKLPKDHNLIFMSKIEKL